MKTSPHPFAYNPIYDVDEGPAYDSETADPAGEYLDQCMVRMARTGPDGPVYRLRQMAHSDGQDPDAFRDRFNLCGDVEEASRGVMVLAQVPGHDPENFNIGPLPDGVKYQPKVYKPVMVELGGIIPHTRPEVQSPTTPQSPTPTQALAQPPKPSWSDVPVWQHPEYKASKRQWQNALDADPTLGEVWETPAALFRTIGVRPVKGHVIAKLNAQLPHGPGNTVWAPRTPKPEDPGRRYWTLFRHWAKALDVALPLSWAIFDQFIKEVGEPPEDGCTLHKIHKGEPFSAVNVEWY